MLIFLAAWAEITNQPKSKKFLSKRGFHVPHVSINCLACPKGVKYKLISNKQEEQVSNVPQYRAFRNKIPS